MKTEQAAAAAAEALERGAWEEARALFERSLAAEESAEAYEGLGLAAWWLDDEQATFAARQAAYSLYREQGDRRGAARIATWIAWDNLTFRGEQAVANGWLQRAHRLLEGVEPCPEQAWLALREGSMALDRDAALARRLGAETAALGRALGDLDFEMSGLALEGLALVCEGQIEAGLRQLDEASTAAVAGELRDLTQIGLVCCDLIAACERVRDYERAAEWCEQLAEFCRRWRIPPLLAVCRTHYAGVLTWRGVWQEAEAELTAATGVLEARRPALAVRGLLRLAELRYRQGRFDEARALVSRLGLNPEAALVLAAIALEEGDADEAVDQAERFLHRVASGDRTKRALGLEISARARAALGHVGSARAALEELETVADSAGTTPLRAAAATTAGFVAVAEGDHDRARLRFEDAVEAYERSGAPFETACVRIELAAALAALGHTDTAASEARAAHEVLAGMGAAHAARRATALLARLSPARGGLTARERDVLALLAAGMSNRDIAARLVLSEHTVHRHVANIRRKLGVSSRTAAAAHAVREGLL